MKRKKRNKKETEKEEVKGEGENWDLGGRRGDICVGRV